jgi:hypothetical protein
LEKEGWQAVHINIALLFLIVVSLHLYLNWGMFWGYIKKKASLGLNLKLEMTVAILVAGMVTAGAIFELSPFNRLMTYNHQIKDYWDRWATEAPSPHAEELSLERFVDNMGLPVADVVKALKADGIEVKDQAATLGRIAEENGTTPSNVYAAIKKHSPQMDHQGKGEGMGRGMGRGKGQGQGRYTDD